MAYLPRVNYNVIMFKDNEKRDVETIIGPSVRVEGDFVGEGNVIIKGIVNGSLKTKGDLRIEEKAQVKADIESANAVIGGSVDGNVTTKGQLELTASARVEGDISCRVLVVAAGAFLNGQCLMQGDKERTPNKAP